MAKKKKQLTGLAAALVKAGKISDKQARKNQREQRREDRNLGEAEVAARKAKVVEEAARKAEAEQVAARQAARSASSEENRALVSAHKLEGWQGRRRWYYVRRDQRLSYFEVSDEVARLLREGQAVIVEGFDDAEGQHFLVKDPMAIGRIHVEDAAHVRFWNQAESRSA